MTHLDNAYIEWMEVQPAEPMLVELDQNTLLNHGGPSLTLEDCGRLLILSIIGREWPDKDELRSARDPMFSDPFARYVLGTPIPGNARHWKLRVQNFWYRLRKTFQELAETLYWRIWSWLRGTSSLGSIKLYRKHLAVHIARYRLSLCELGVLYICLSNLAWESNFVIFQDVYLFSMRDLNQFKKFDCDELRQGLTRLKEVGIVSLLDVGDVDVLDNHILVNTNIAFHGRGIKDSNQVRHSCDSFNEDLDVIDEVVIAKLYPECNELD